MNFKTAASVEQVIWNMLLNAQISSGNRALINSLANGAPPYTSEEAEQNHIATNVNTLEMPERVNEARSHLANAICSADPLFTINLDYGPMHKRKEWASIIEKAINKRLVNSGAFYDLREGVAGSTVLHGIAPSMWDDDQKWLQTELGPEDILMPSNTLRSLSNLSLFAVYRSYSLNQLWKMTQGPRVDPGWQMGVVNGALEYLDKETGRLYTDNWKDQWYPEKRVERFKEDGGMYASDLTPTVDAYDFFYWDDDGEQQGWKRRIIIDAWGQPGVGGVAPTIQTASQRRKGWEFAKGKFLYDSGDRIYADKLEKIIHFQFGDASAVRPARIKSIRSLGFLLYSVCHLQNRLKCKFNDAVFESLMQYFRVADPADRDRLQEIDLVHMKVLPEGLTFVRPEDRWKIDQSLVSEGIAMNQQSIADKSAAFSQDYDDQQGENETARRTNARLNNQASLMSNMMNAIYYREAAREREICRRFCIKNSKDSDVKSFRVEVLSQGVPEEALNVDRWDVQINKVMGGGSRMMQMFIADKMMASRTAYPPEAQNDILRLNAAAVTGDYKLAAMWTPEVPHISNSIHDTEQTFGTFLAGGVVRPRPGLNPIEVAQTMLQLIQGKVQQILQTDGMGTPQQVQGLAGAVQYTQAFIAQLAEDKSQKSLVKQLNDQLKNEANEIKAMAQRHQQQAQKQQGGMDAKDMAKVQGMMLIAKTKADLAAQSHAQRTAQRQLQFEQKQRQDEQKAALEMAKDRHDAALDIATKRVNLFEE